MNEPRSSASTLRRRPAALKRSRGGRLVGRIGASVPGWREAVLGSLCWGLAVAASALASLWRITAWIDSHLPAVIAIFFIGGFVAYVPARIAAQLASAGRPATARFSAAFVSLTTATLAAAALGFALWHLHDDLDWSEFGLPGFPYLDIVFSIAEGVIQFIALGVRLFLPSGLPGLVAGSLWMMRR